MNFVNEIDKKHSKLKKKEFIEYLNNEVCKSQDPIMNTEIDHFRDLLEVLDFACKYSDRSILNERIISLLEFMTLKRIEGDSDLVLHVMNFDYNKNINLCLPHLFKPSTMTQTNPRTSYYQNIIQCINHHLTKYD